MIISTPPPQNLPAQYVTSREQRREKGQSALPAPPVHMWAIYSPGLVLTLFLVAAALFFRLISCFLVTCSFLVPSLRPLPVCSRLPEFYAGGLSTFGIISWNFFLGSLMIKDRGGLCCRP